MDEPEENDVFCTSCNHSKGKHYAESAQSIKIGCSVGKTLVEHRTHVPSCTCSGFKS